jgi:hypothetical protein
LAAISGGNSSYHIANIFYKWVSTECKQCLQL